MPRLVDTVKEIQSRLSSATSGVRADIEQLRATIKAKRAELVRVASAPLPLPEAEERIAAHVQVEGERWLRDWHTTLVHGERALAAYDPEWDPSTPMRHTPRVPWTLRESPPWGAFCLSDPAGAAALLAGLLRALKDSGHYVEGMPLAERPAAAKQLEVELAALEAAEEDVIDGAHAGGINIAHRPEVISRRATGARQRELDEEATSNRLARQAALNERHRSRAANGRTTRNG
jgi:hypothetical protein